MKEIQMKKLPLFVMVLLSVLALGSVIAHAELTPPVNGESDDAVVGVATDEDPGDSSVVDLSDIDTTQLFNTPDEDTLAGIATDEEDPGDSGVVDPSDSTTEYVDSPSFDNAAPSGMAPGEPIDGKNPDFS